jgi:hypothetical protein
MSKRGQVVFLALLSVGYLSWCGVYIARTSFTVDNERVFCLWDDAMISMQYARNLRRGEGLVWNAGGERVQGYTNLAVTLTMAAIHYLPLTPNRISLAVQLLNMVFLQLILLLMWRIARRMFPDTIAVAVGTAIATVLCAPLAIWSLQGSDVGFVTLWLCSSLAIFVSSEQSGEVNPWKLFPVLALGLLIRPDMGMYYVLFWAAAIWLPGKRMQRAMIGIGFLVVVAGGVISFSQLYYGDPLPNTYYLKATGSPKSLMLAFGARQTAEWLPRIAAPILLAAVAALLMRKSRSVALCVACFVAAFAYNIWVGGDWGYETGSRFQVPTLPLLLMLAVAGSWQVCRRLLPVGVWKSKAGGTIFVCVVVALGLVASPRVAFTEWFNPNTMTKHLIDNRSNYWKGDYFQEFTRPETTIGVHWGGVPSYFGERTAIDVLGKSDRHIAKMTVSGFAPGHSKWDWDYIVNEKKPDIIIGVSNGLDQRLDFRTHYYGVGRQNQFMFYLRKGAVNRLTDDTVYLFDQVSQEFFDISKMRDR